MVVGRVNIRIFITFFSFTHRVTHRGRTIRGPFVLEKYMGNPRYKNGALRRKYRARLKAMQAPCGICGGRLGPIHYDEPSDSQHPLSFVIDEIKPISKYKMFGYASPEAAAQDPHNIQAAHYICNQAKSNKVGWAGSEMAKKLINIKDGDW